MSARTIGAVLVLAIAGVAAGYGVSSLDTETPTTISVAAPVPAESPSYPMNEYDVAEDPGVAPLAPSLPLKARILREGGYRFEVSIPQGWMTAPLDGPGWNFSVASNPPNTYVLRVEALSRTSVSGALTSRLARLGDAEDHGDLVNLVVESTTEDEFVASYIQGEHRRVAMERFLSLPGTSTYVTVAVSGRDVDREGMADLLERVSASLRIP